MKKLITIIALTICFKSYSQDSVRLKIIYSKRIGDTVYYQFKILGTLEHEYKKKEKVNSKCCCLVQQKKGEVIKRAVKDLEFIKQDL